MRTLITSTLFALTVSLLSAQGTDSTSTDSLAFDTQFLENVVISSTRAGDDVPATYTEVEKEELDKLNLGQDLPILLDQQPSIVTTSDAGAGIGYTGLRLRGSDQSRINVTINGIPYNDAESQGVFWVNMPDLSSSVSSIQIQRGVGTSTNGAGAFGGTISIRTTDADKEAFGEVSGSYGSFNSYKTNLLFGTGLIKNKFAFQGRVSKIGSDGYIDRASSDLISYMASGAYYGKKDILRFMTFGGKEVTYQSWNGIDEATMQTDRTFNSAGTEKPGQPHKDEVDNYRQDHYQLIYSRELSKKFYQNVALHYTRGRGYFEQYKADEDLADYGFDDVVTGNDTITSTDLIRRRWLDNYFYGATYSLEMETKKVGLIVGGGWNQYLGEHFGEVIWAQYVGDTEYEQRYYENRGIKNDLNIYTKLNWKPTDGLNLFIDLQYRNVTHLLGGIDSDRRFISLDKSFNFFNPKAGISYNIKNAHKLYGFFGIGHREPTRGDFIDAVVGAEPKPERMYNMELGYTFNHKYVQLNANYYLMYYKDQLVLTGELNDVGSPVRTNVEQSYRTGIELMLAVKPIEQVTLNLNGTYSFNRIKEFNEVLYQYDADYNYEGAVINSYSNSPISFSPDWILAQSLSYRPVKGLELELYNKYISRQYLDNTGNKDRSLKGYDVTNFRVSYTFKLAFMKEISLSVLVNNLFNREYSSNGYTFSELYSNGTANPDRGDYNYYYPQAGINALGSIKIRF